MEKLKKLFKKGQRDFEQVYEDNCWYIYRVTLHHKSPDAEETFYEVFKKRVRPVNVYDRTLNSWIRTEETREAYPSDEDFGDWAWCCNTIERCKVMIERHSVSEV